MRINEFLALRPAEFREIHFLAIFHCLFSKIAKSNAFRIRSNPAKPLWRQTMRFLKGWPITRFLRRFLGSKARFPDIFHHLTHV